MVVVTDAGPLIHLDELGEIDLLVDFPRVLVPEAVWDEVTQHRPGALLPSFMEKMAAHSSSSELNAIGRLYTLHHGEWQALALCVHFAGSRLLTDDTAARLAAKALNIAASGTIGILLRAMRRGQHDKTQTLALLEAIPTQTSLHIRSSLLAQIIAEVRSP